jgi:hypothetical protein
MNYPKLNEIPTTRDMIDKFKGYNHNLRISEGEFYHTENLTGDHYPVLSPRKQRGIYKNTSNANGLCSNTELCYVSGSKIYIGNNEIDLKLTQEPKDMISFGSYVIVLPDQKYVNTVNHNDQGDLKQNTYYLPTSESNKVGEVVMELVDMYGHTLLNGSNRIWVGTVGVSDGTAYRNAFSYWQCDLGNRYDYGGDYWLRPITNSKGETNWYLYQLFKYTDGTYEWHEATSTGIKSGSGGDILDPKYAGVWFDLIHDESLGSAPFVGVHFKNANEGATKITLDAISKDAETASGDKFVKVRGLVDRWNEFTKMRVLSIGEGAITDKRNNTAKLGLILDGRYTDIQLGDLIRAGQIGSIWAPMETTSVMEVIAPYDANADKIPIMDFVIESQNRLWGCRYGPDHDGNFVNEIYASEWGNFKSWNKLDGISTDSTVLNVATSGKFTGAVNYGGYPVFFKEDCIHRVFGNYTGQYQVQTTMGRGVQAGCHDSIAIINEILYYKARSGVCAYDGSMPIEISQALGGVEYEQAVAGGLGNKYYISMKRKDKGEWHMFSYDTQKGLWFREDDTQATKFCNHQGNLYYIDYADHNIKGVKGENLPDIEHNDDPIKWGAETGILGANTPDNKSVSRIDVRMMLTFGARVTFYIEYDSSENWEYLFTMDGTSLRSFTIPVHPKRCDHFRLKIVGSGDAKIYSISKTIEEA